MSITTAGNRLEVTHASTEAPIVIDDPTEPTDQTARTDYGTGPGVDVAEVQASARPTFTITDAASSCTVSRKTITRKLPELAGHGAAKDDDGVWRIPVEALLAVGLHPGRSLPEVVPSPTRASAPLPLPIRPTDQDTVTISRDRWDDVRIRLARAEAEAAERGFALADARLALRALTAGPVVSDRAPYPATGLGATAAAGLAEAAPAATASTPDLVRVEGILAADHAVAPRSGLGADPQSAPAETPATPGAAGPESAAGPADVVAARNRAARTGGYVPAGAPSGPKRRWWQAR